MPTQSPLNYTPARHALLHQIATTTGTPSGWTRTPNPRKTDPTSGLPDHLYTTRDTDNPPTSMNQRATRQLDLNGLLGPEPTGGTDDLTTSTLGARALADWTEKHGTPTDPR